MLKPINDLAMVELQDDDKYGFGDGEKAPERGILIALPDKMIYLGFNSFAFEDSLANKESLEIVYKHYERLIGKMVYWGEYSERGSVVTYEGKKYAFLKLTSLLCEDDEINKEGYVSQQVAGKSFKI